jgi:hypothetical protein
MLTMNSKSYTLPSVIPFDTSQAVENFVDGENLYVRIGDSLNSILQGLPPSIFEYPLQQLPIPAYIFALVTIFQRRKELTDADMAEALRNRPEVRYALRLPLRHPNIPVSSLCRYRQLLYNDPVAFEVFEQISDRIAAFSGEMNFVRNSTCTIAESVCLRNRTNIIITRMLEVLEALAATYPDWMREIIPTYWYDRYHRSATKFVKMSLDESTLEMILAIGNDMKYILQLAKQEQRLADLPEVQSLEEVFYENYEVELEVGKVHWKATMCSADLRDTLRKMDVS